MSWQAITMDWPGNRAILLVHGIGLMSESYYDGVVQALRDIPGLNLDDFAVYPFLYDSILDWMNEKAQFEQLAADFRALKDAVGDAMGGEGYEAEMGRRVGDVIAPVLSLDVRHAVKTAYEIQLKQLLLDGMRPAGQPKRPLVDLNVSVICHSFGCLHTYEMLHSIAHEPGMRPGTEGFKFANVVFMASPVQLVNTVGRKLGVAIPRPEEMATLASDELTQPFQDTKYTREFSVQNWASITGNLDIAGGYLYGHKLDWAYMDVPGQDSYVDDQIGRGPLSKEDILKAFAPELPGDIGGGEDPAVEDPHSWPGYITRHAEHLKGWLTQ